MSRQDQPQRLSSRTHLHRARTQHDAWSDVGAESLPDTKDQERHNCTEALATYIDLSYPSLYPRLSRFRHTDKCSIAVRWGSHCDDVVRLAVPQWGWNGGLGLEPRSLYRRANRTTTTTIKIKTKNPPGKYIESPPLYINGFSISSE